MQTIDYLSGLHNCLEFSQPSSCLDQVTQTRKKVLYSAFYSLPIQQNCVLPVVSPHFYWVILTLFAYIFIVINSKKRILIDNFRNQVKCFRLLCKSSLFSSTVHFENFVVNHK